MYCYEPQEDERDLSWMCSAGITTLMDKLCDELKTLKGALPSLPSKVEGLDATAQAKLLDLCLQYGFLKCHRIYETGYTEKDLFEIMHSLEEKKQNSITKS